MMKNKAYLPVLNRTPIGITLLMLFFALSLTTKINASYCEEQPNGSIVTISGYVTCQGESISDVTVEAETTSDVSISDSDGKFSITVKKEGVLIFQKNGYTPYEHIANDFQENLIVCLSLENDSTYSSKQQKETTKEENECIIIIMTKKEP